MFLPFSSSSVTHLKWNLFSLIRGYSHRQNCIDLIASKRKLIQAEYELLKHRNKDNVPSKLDESNLEYLASLSKQVKRRTVNWLEVSYKLRQQELAKLRLVETFEGKDSLCFPITSANNEKLLRRKQVSLIPFLPNLIFDISFDEYMSSLECKNLAEQLIRIFTLNKYGIEANLNYMNQNLFNLHVTNLGSSINTKAFLDSQFYTQFYYPNVFLHQKAFTEIFSGKKLIYLSPHAKEVISEYDHDAFYIIGGIVDRREIIELTPAKCKQLEIPSMRLPIQEHVHQSQQVQSLYDVYKFLHEFKYNSNPFNANNIATFVQKHIPKKTLKIY